MLLADPTSDVRVMSTAMACEISVRAVNASRVDATPSRTRQSLDEALQVFADVDRTCTRFSATSDLMRANARGDEFVTVDRYCFDALVEAYAAYRRTHGRFDPRVLDDLVRLGYDESYRRRHPQARDAQRALSSRPAPGSWEPSFRGESSAVRIGADAVDLGGIGKGLALRWAADRLRQRGLQDFFVEAGGDCLCVGRPADAAGWRVAVEDPSGGPDPVAVLEVRDEAVATSSVRIRSWQVAGRPVHHLIDPATGLPGGEGLLAVTVVDADPARAEVWSKVLFLAGRDAVAPTAAFLQLPALWVDVDGGLGVSPDLGARMIWRAA